MDSTLNPAVKRQLLFIGASLGISLVLTYFFGFLIGFALNIAIFLGLIFYIRKKQTRGLRSLGFSDERIGGGYTNSGTGLDRKSTRLNSSHSSISYAVFCL